MEVVTGAKWGRLGSGWVFRGEGVVAQVGGGDVCVLGCWDRLTQGRNG